MNITVFMTNRCNMKCLYCYEGYKINTSISYITLDNIVKFISKKNLDQKNNLVIHGGEPLLEFKKIEYFIESLKKYNLYSKFNLHITTNGTLINSKNARYLKDNFHDISISLDGNKYYNDINRVLNNNKGTYTLVINNLEQYFSDYYKNLTARMTINVKNVKGVSSSVTHLADLGFIKISPVVDQFCDWDNENLIILRNEFDKIVQIVKENKIYNGIDVGFIKDAMYRCKNTKCDGGISTFTINTDGSIYPCIVTNNIPEFCIGNLNENIYINQNKLESLLSHNNELNKCCIGCSRYDYCDATRCKLINKIQTGEWNIPSTNVCEIHNLKVDLAEKFL